MLVSANNTSSVWQYFAKVKDGSIMRNKIQSIYYCLLCLKKRRGKFLGSLVAIYNDTTVDANKHIASMHPNLHLARKRQSLESKQLILISIFTSANTNNISAFIKSGNDVVIERIHVLIARLVINHKVPSSLATDVNLNEVIQAVSYLKPGSYVLMMLNKIDCAFISMFSKFTVCINAYHQGARNVHAGRLQ
jgi:hypothetical protein